mmetsp:Transcript_16034/g.18136  ORF Transcript_16034/g.18136 Transcript_16034/m.18136 type:complete len:185 (+) Transcript_16034:164-718(+)|eukprot:CAMPEP_0184045144 /NCGR_PEP_ID=MMETSP0956-20121227/723_1 /TAXON_ID=627963 /ORGANISM="Aplanochytrium sp, Strain PBS07" /LENGTH=184 /DNA_ID=CAMNT_0026336355 /DNA_START=132 /DNA_END=686 /DNA_ORIENTATION=-
MTAADSSNSETGEQDSDSSVDSNPEAHGYQRILLSPSEEPETNQECAFDCTGFVDDNSSPKLDVADIMLKNLEADYRATLQAEERNHVKSLFEDGDDNSSNFPLELASGSRSSVLCEDTKISCNGGSIKKPDGESHTKSKEQQEGMTRLSDAQVSAVLTAFKSLKLKKLSWEDYDKLDQVVADS